MSIPNLANTAYSFGVTKGGAIGTGWTTLVGNADNNMQSYGVIPTDYSAKVHTLIFTNIDGSNAVDVSVDFYNSANGSTWRLANTISVPADTNLVMISNDTPIWLDEGDYIRAFASAASDLTFACSFTLFAD